jgi:DNA invertase Pin-like site-specific DNA recombinase
MDRPAFRKLQADIFNGTVKTVIVWKLDRLARKIKDGVNIIADWCEQGVRIVSTTQQIDLSGPAGHLFASMLFGIAEIELQHVKERQAAGIAVAKEKGIYQGRKKGTTKAKPERVRELQARGLTALEIANALNVSERTVFRYLEAH